MNSREVISRLKKEGWELVNIRGSHHQYKHPSKVNKITVPHPKKDLPIKTVKSIFSSSRLGLEKMSKRFNNDLSYCYS